jgi:hypothetical protein
MTLKKSVVFVLLIFAISLSGCATGGSFLAQNVTNIELSGTNFDIIARNLEGSAHADYLIGFGTSAGAVSNTLALVRVGGTATLYDDAIRSLWQNYEKNYGSTEGRNLVLANVRYDTDILNLLLFTKTTLYIHADVVEFKE